MSPNNGIEATIQAFKNDPGILQFIRIKYLGSPGKDINTDPRVQKRMQSQRKGILISNTDSLKDEIINQLQAFLALSPAEMQTKSQEFIEKRQQELAG